jgi:hypothetical protein
MLMLIAQINYGQNCFVNSYETLDFEQGNSTLVVIDSTNPNNLWQIGNPQKNVLDSAFSASSVIITDTVNSYPPNNTSRFTKTRCAGDGFTFSYAVILSGYYWVNSDSLNDFGLIEFSPDNGNTWIDLINDTVYNAYYSWPGSKPTLTGTSNGWQYFYINLERLGEALNIQGGDTTLYRFTFISDSIPDSLDGLMYDNLNFVDYALGIEELGYDLIASNAYPNPTSNNFIIELDNKNFSEFDLFVYDNSGRLVLKKEGIINSRTEINTTNLNGGIYYYKLINPKRKLKTTGKVMVKK